MRNRVAGWCFLGLGGLHVLVVCAMAGGVLLDMVVDGWWMSVGEDSLRGMAFWSLCFGGLLAVVGGLLMAVPRVPLSTAIVLLITCVMGLAVYPVSGFLLATPVAASLLWQRSNA